MTMKEQISILSNQVNDLQNLIERYEYIIKNKDAKLSIKDQTSEVLRLDNTRLRNELIKATEYIKVLQKSGLLVKK